MDSTTPAATGLEDWVRVAEHADGQALAEPIFQRRYRAAAPDFPIHVLAHCRIDDGRWLPACYIHVTVDGRMLLGGGVCVDDRVLRRLPFAARRRIHAAGGLYLHTLRWAMQHFGPRCDAMFGYCGDVLAERLDLAAGFRKTAHKHLLVYTPRPLPEAEEQALVARAHAASPF